MSKELKPFLYQCDCGWTGDVHAMTDSYCCPECGSFKNVQIVITIKRDQVVSKNIA